MLVHGRDDPIIPETESMALAAAVGAGRARLYLVDSLDHVDPKPAGLVDRLVLLRAIAELLEIRDEGAWGTLRFFGPSPHPLQAALSNPFRGRPGRCDSTWVDNTLREGVRRRGAPDQIAVARFRVAAICRARESGLHY